MRVFLTGAGGFVGRWLGAELRRAGHDTLDGAADDYPRGPDVTDPRALADALRATEPDAIVHLAAIAAPREAARNPELALAVNVGGTANVLEAARQRVGLAAILVVGSSEVYGHPPEADLPLREDAPLRATGVYGLSKLAQESLALAYAAREQLPLAVTRSFNHIGPGQRADFVVPALAQRIREARSAQPAEVAVGNLDVARDFTDVRDVVRAYRSLLEALAGGSVPPGGAVYNVASGTATSIRRIFHLLCGAAGYEPRVHVDPTLVREGEPREVRGDATALSELTGWQPEIPLAQTIDDVWGQVKD